MDKKGGVSVADTQEIPQLPKEVVEKENIFAEQSEKVRKAASESARAQMDALAMAAVKLTGQAAESEFDFMEPINFMPEDDDIPLQPQKKSAKKSSGKKEKKTDSPVKKKNPFVIFMVGFMKTLLFICVMAAVGLGSYKLSYYMLDKQADKNAEEATNKEIQDIKEAAKTDEISKNLIYVTDDNNNITNMMLEICNTKTNNMDYVTIPTKTDYTIPTNMYQKLSTINQEIPQILRISRMKKYFENDEDAYGYGKLIVEKMIGCEISYYTAIDQNIFNTLCAQTKVKITYTPSVTPEASASPSPTPDEENNTSAKKSTRQKTKIDVIHASDTYINELKAIQGDQKKTVEFIENQYKRITSNLTVYNKIGYIDTYLAQDCTLYHYWGLPCALNGKVYTVDKKVSKKFLKTLINNETPYTEAHDLTVGQNITKIISGGTAAGSEKASKNDTEPTAKPKKVSSKKKKIIVLNGSQIAGLAASVQEKLKADGYKVPEVGNYEADTLTRTKILVKKEGQGTDLEKYFKNPDIEVGMVEEGYDIQIIVGTADANN